MRGKCLSPCVPSSFMELVFCTHLCDGHEDVSLRGLTEGHSLINDSSCHALKSISTLPWPGFRMLLLSIYCATRTSSSGAPGGPTSPCMGSLGSRALQQHCWTSTPTALLGFHPGFLPSSSPLLRVRPPPAFQLCPRFLCVSSCKGTNPTTGLAPS